MSTDTQERERQQRLSLARNMATDRMQASRLSNLSAVKGGVLRLGHKLNEIARPKLDAMHVCRLIRRCVHLCEMTFSMPCTSKCASWHSRRQTAVGWELRSLLNKVNGVYQERIIHDDALHGKQGAGARGMLVVQAVHVVALVPVGGQGT